MTTAANLDLVRSVKCGLEMAQLGGLGPGVFRVRGGEVTRLVAYRDRARADLGLEA